jgi:hypothetical protein
VKSHVLRHISVESTGNPLRALAYFTGEASLSPPASIWDHRRVASAQVQASVSPWHAHWQLGWGQAQAAGAETRFRPVCHTGTRGCAIHAACVGPLFPCPSQGPLSPCPSQLSESTEAFDFWFPERRASLEHFQCSYWKRVQYSHLTVTRTVQGTRLL